MHAREPQSSGFQPSAVAKKAEGFAPRPFEVTFPGQEATSPTNPFSRRPHEVWMGESTGGAAENQEQSDAPGVELDWSRISLYAEGQTPPEPPQWPRVQAKFAIAHSDDPYDQEADRTAEQVSSGTRANQEQSQPKQITPLVQRQPDFSHVDWFSHAPQRRPIHPLQTKLTIGQPNDPYEQEADQVAEQVMSMPESASVQREMGPEEEEVQTKPLAATITPLVQREAMPEEEDVQTKPLANTLQREAMPEEEEPVQTKPLGNSVLQREEMPEEGEALQTKASPTPYSLLPTPLIQREAMPEEEEVQTKPLADMVQRQEMPEEEEAVQTKPSLQQATDGSLQAGGNLESRLNDSQGGGNPLPQDVKGFMESRFRTDFSQVRVHTDSEAVQMNRDLNAQAFTHKQDVYFGAGKSPGKDALTAHELTHVVQQMAAVPPQQGQQDANAKVQPSIRSITAVSTKRLMRAPTDQKMQDAAFYGENSNANDNKVRVIYAHSTVADESEAKEIIRNIDAAQDKVAKHPVSSNLDLLKDNVQAKFTLEKYLSSVSDSGDFQSQYAASYMNTKRDYGEFAGMWSVFEAAHGNLKEKSQEGGLQRLDKDPSFARARAAFQATRNNLQDDKQQIDTAQTKAEAAKAGMMSAIYSARAKVANATAKKKQAEKDKVLADIDNTVSVLMKVGKMAAAATTGIMAMEGGGIDFSTMVESPGIAPGIPSPKPAVNPSSGAREIDFDKPSTPAPAVPDAPNYTLPSQTISNLKGVASQGVDLAGGPEKLLKSAITMLEASKIDSLSAQISAAQEEGNLNEAAADAATLVQKRKEYQAGIDQLVNNVANLMNHKKQMDNAVREMVDIAKKHGASKDLTGAVRLVGAGDKFLSQVDLTIRLGQQQQEKGKAALAQRGAINSDPYAPQGGEHAQGPVQLHWWSVTYKSDGSYADKIFGGKHWQAIKHPVELQASGKSSLTSSSENSTQFDVGKSLEELNLWKKDIEVKRNKAQDALGIGVASGTSK